VILGVAGNSNIDFLLILPCIWREMDNNKGSGNRDTLYYRKHVTSYVSLNSRDAEGGKSVLIKAAKLRCSARWYKVYGRY
jgi:hypothetical protein